MNIKEMQDRAWKHSEDKGFHSTPEQLNIPSKLMLVVSELSEALEEYRDGKAVWYRGINGKPEGIAAELADAVIRIGDLAGIIGFDLEAVIIDKMGYNDTRPYMHGGKTI